MKKNKKPLWIAMLIAALAIGAVLLFTGDADTTAKTETATEDEHGHAEGESEEGEEFERGPHEGRMLRNGDFAVEVTIFEDGVPPEFRVFVYEDDKLMDPSQVRLSMELTRLGGEVNRYSFQPKDDMLMGDAVVAEPHSFDVTVKATYGDQTYDWAYASYEGRTTLSEEAAQAAGIETVVVGPGPISETVRLSGRVVLNQNRSAAVKARFPGIVRGVFKEIGAPVKRGEKLATVESNESLQVYIVPSPLDGVVLQRSISVGDTAADAPIFTVADLSSLWVEFYVFAADMANVQNGQRVMIRTLDGKAETESTIDTVQPMAEASSQTVVARGQIDNSSGQWRAGMTVQGDAVVRAQDVALAVPTSALQRMGNKDVVFVHEGNHYEAVPVTLGIADPQWTEVTEGLKPGVEVVAKNSFVIKADIAKAGAQHEH